MRFGIILVSHNNCADHNIIILCNNILYYACVSLIITYNILWIGAKIEDDNQPTTTTTTTQYAIPSYTWRNESEAERRNESERGGGRSRGGRVSKAWLGFQLQRRSFSADGGWGNNIMSTIKTRNNDKPCYSHISRIRIVITPKPKQTPSTSTHAFSKYTLYISTNLCLGNVYKDILLNLLRESTQKNAGSTLRGLTQKTKKEWASRKGCVFSVFLVWLLFPYITSTFP